MKKCCIIGGNWQVQNLMEVLGYSAVDAPDDADLLVFTGGADVTPRLYGDIPHRTTSYDLYRDMAEKAIYDEYVNKVPMVGICRGGQFLHVMNGGSMWQDVDNHAIGNTHGVVDLFSPGWGSGNWDVYQCTSTHHQMMRGDVGVVVGVASPKRSTYKCSGTHTEAGDNEHDVEVVWHPDTRCLSFQPHPEYDVNGATRQYFELLLKRYGL
jgi:gamma-glutamyl-gamma-aminobutyrate hydrolase PuuD